MPPRLCSFCSVKRPDGFGMLVVSVPGCIAVLYVFVVKYGDNMQRVGGGSSRPCLVKPAQWACR